MKKLKIYIRADGGGIRTGLGHLMRCLAVADIFKNQHHEVFFVSKEYPIALEILKERKYPVKIIPENFTPEEDLSLTKKITADGHILILDGYEWQESSLQILCYGSLLIACFDDLFNRNLPVDIVIASPYATATRYHNKISSFTTLLFGLQYLPLRKEFKDLPPHQINKKMKAILLNFGGEDPDNMTTEILERLNHLPQKFSLHILIGAAFRHKETLEKSIDSSKHLCTVYTNLKKTVPLLQKIDLAIAAGGSTTWELAAAGIPMILISIALNQAHTIEYCSLNQLAISLNDKTLLSLEEVIESLDYQKRVQLSQKTQKLVDGEGAIRLTETLLFLYETKILLRRPPNDPSSLESMLIWNWRNDELTKKMSKNVEDISWEEHQEWFSFAIKDPNQHLFIAYQANIPIGTVRLIHSKDTGKISININPDMRKKGLGKKIIKEICSYGFQTLKLHSLTAEIKQENVASMKVFEENGFSFLKKSDNGFSLFITHITQHNVSS